MSSTPSKLVNVSEDAEIRIIRLLMSGQPESAIAAALRDWESGNATSLLKRVPLQTLPSVPSAEAAAAVALASAWIDGTPASEHGQYVRRLAAVLRPKLDLSMALYDARGDPRERRHVLVANLIPHPRALSGLGPIPALLLGDGLDALLTEAPPDERRAAYRAAATALTAGAALLPSPEDGTEHAQKYLIKLVKSYGDGDPVDAMAIAAAREVCVGAIRDPVRWFQQQRDLLKFPAIQALKQADPPLHALFEIVQTGNLSDYEAFVKRSGALPHGLSQDELRTHMRTLTLCSLAALQANEELGYDDIAKELSSGSVDDATVESWIVSAVASGLVSAKMDQMERSVLVERCAVRGAAFDWKVLQARLRTWKTHTADILESYKAAQRKLGSVGAE